MSDGVYRAETAIDGYLDGDDPTKKELPIVLIGRSGTYGAVPVRSTTRESSFLVMVTTIGSSFFDGSSLSR